MDNTRIFIDKLADFISSCKRPPLIYAAMQTGRSYNDPAPIAGISYLAKGNLGPWTVGGKPVTRPRGHIAIGHCYQGGYSPIPDEPIELWSVAFNLAGIKEFEYLQHTQIQASTPVRSSTQVESAFQVVATRFASLNTDPLFIKASILELIAVTREAFSGNNDIATFSRPVQKAISWAQQNMNSAGLRLAEMAEISGLSEHHFSRVFLRVTGTTPMKYLTMIRIQQAKGLLEGTDLRVSEVAYSVGFPDPLHFSRVFRRITGKCPSDFRSNNAPSAAAKKGSAAINRL